MDPATSAIMQPIFQYGFAGLSAVLLGILVWMIRRLLTLLESNGAIIANNTNALENLTERMHTMDDVRDRMLKRPCMMKEDS